MKNTFELGKEYGGINISLEYQLLAELIFNRELIPVAVKRLKGSHFTQKESATIWKAIFNRYNQKESTDLTSIAHEVGTDIVIKYIVPVNTNTYVNEVTLEEHISQVILNSTKYHLYERAVRLMHATLHEQNDFPELIARVEDINSIFQNMQPEKHTMLDDIVNDYAAELEEMQKLAKSGKNLRVPSGFPSLDRILYTGFAPGNLIILAARPSVGKTAVMLHMAKAACKAGFTPTIFNLEMENNELAQRILVSSGHVEQKKLATANFDWTSMEKAMDYTYQYKIRMYDDVYSMDEIAYRIAMGRNDGTCDIAFIDYLGLISREGKETLDKEIGKITSRLKAIAKKCGIPIVLLCQLNRSHINENRPPELVDLRDSGAIEQDADIALILEKDGINNDGANNINMWIRKNRQCIAGNIYIEITANGTYTDFTDMGLKKYNPTNRRSR